MLGLTLGAQWFMLGAQWFVLGARWFVLGAWGFLDTNMLINAYVGVLDQRKATTQIGLCFGGIWP